MAPPGPSLESPLVKLLAKWLKVTAIRERPVQRYSDLFDLGAEGQDFGVEVDF